MRKDQTREYQTREYLIAFDVDHDERCLTLFSLPSLVPLEDEISDEKNLLQSLYINCKEKSSGADVYVVHSRGWVSRSGAHSLHSAGISPALRTMNNDVFVFKVLASVHSIKPRDFDELYMAAIAKLPHPPPRRVGYFAWRTRRGFHDIELVEPLGARELMYFIIPEYYYLFLLRLL